ncbi:MAG: acyl-ACP--UDP-N-acetylglucosamine O-acyltransferase [Elusimicrobia bacterium]|nr:acyl-ACP--UDP-N-acetylglucosamine O-acyltransferase [Elusimicrobiota bacterium]
MIHPTAVIGPDVKLADNVRIGPYVVIDGDVTIGSGTEIGAHTTISGWTRIGEGNRIFPHASIGQDPQDKKHKRDDKTWLEIGSNNVFREFTTANRGTIDGGGVTRIGNGNLFMAYSHAAHDCQVGDGCVLANSVALAGHVHVEDRAIVGGLVGVHQFVRIGTMSMIGGCTKVSQDIPPFAMSVGIPALVYGLNIVGLRRSQMPTESIKALKEAFRVLFFSGLSRSSALERVEREVPQGPDVRRLVEFVRSSERGVTAGSTSVAAEE